MISNKKTYQWPRHVKRRVLGSLLLQLDMSSSTPSTQRIVVVVVVVATVVVVVVVVVVVELAVTTESLKEEINYKSCDSLRVGSNNFEIISSLVTCHYQLSVQPQPQPQLRPQQPQQPQQPQPQH